MGCTIAIMEFNAKNCRFKELNLNLENGKQTPLIAMYLIPFI